MREVRFIQRLRDAPSPPHEKLELRLLYPCHAAGRHAENDRLIVVTGTGV